MTSLKVVIVDDEAHARERLRRLIGHMPDIDVVAECASGQEAVATNTRLRPDLMLLDVQMPEMTGFAVIRAIPVAELPLIVFVTAYDHHALEAFDVHAVDYLLKPVESPRLAEALDRVRARLRQESLERHQTALAEVASRSDMPVQPVVDEVAATEGSSPLPGDRFLLRDGGTLHAVAADDILWIEAQGNYARINLPDNRSYLIRSTMSVLESRLDRLQFARIHRSAIVNLDAVRELQPWFGGDYVVILKNGARLKASRNFKSRLDRFILG